MRSRDSWDASRFPKSNHIESPILSAMQPEEQEQDPDQVPHWRVGQLHLLFNLPDGHWFYEAFPRLSRTPDPEEILAPVSSPGLVREVEDMSDEGTVGEDEEEGEEGTEGGLDEDGNDREHRWRSSSRVHPTDSVYRSTVNEVEALRASVAYRHANHVALEDAIVPFHELNHGRMPMPSC
jgi:hypothetical protein